MAVSIAETDKSFLESAILGYLHGSCYALAVALHRGLGWPLVGLMYGEDIVHAGVRSPGGSVWDARGEISEEEFCKPFSYAERIMDVAERDLLAKCEKEAIEHQIKTAGKEAQALWPVLPWKKETHISKTIAFAEELEKLSRKYGRWICGPVPGVLPTIFDGEGDKFGYELAPTFNGNAFLINRKL